QGREEAVDVLFGQFCSHGQKLEALCDAGRRVGSRRWRVRFGLVIRGGTGVDGSGLGGYRADVGIVGDRIALVGRIKEQGAREIDADGLLRPPAVIAAATHSSPPTASSSRRGSSTPTRTWTRRSSGTARARIPAGTASRPS